MMLCFLVLQKGVKEVAIRMVGRSSNNLFWLWSPPRTLRRRKTQPSHEDEPVDDDPSKPTSIFENWSEGGEGGRTIFGAGRLEGGGGGGGGLRKHGHFLPTWFLWVEKEGDKLDICGAGLQTERLYWGAFTYGL